MAELARVDLRDAASPHRLALARVSFETPGMRRIEEALLSIRLQLAEDERITFGAFDTAFTRCFTCTDPGVNMRLRHPELFGTNNEIAGDLLSWAGIGVADMATTASSLVLPGAGRLVKRLRNLPSHVREWWDRRGKSVLGGLDALSPDARLARLPAYLGADLCDAMVHDPRLWPVILFDAHEPLWEKRGDARSAPRRDEWLRLHLQVVDDENLIESGHQPSAGDFGASHPEILTRFLDHLPDNEESVLRLASHPLDLTETRSIDLAVSFPGGAAHINRARFAARSFIVEPVTGVPRCIRCYANRCSVSNVRNGPSRTNASTATCSRRPTQRSNRRPKHPSPSPTRRLISRRCTIVRGSRSGRFLSGCCRGDIPLRRQHAGG